MRQFDELEELRVSLDRIRSLLEKLLVRGLRACGPEELAQIASFAEHLEQTGAGHLAAVLFDLRSHIERDQRSSAQALLQAQTNVRLLERLLTLRVVRQRYAAALEATADAEFPDLTESGEDEQEGHEE